MAHTCYKVLGKQLGIQKYEICTFKVITASQQNSFLFYFLSVFSCCCLFLFFLLELKIALSDICINLSLLVLQSQLHKQVYSNELFKKRKKKPEIITYFLFIFLPKILNKFLAQLLMLCAIQFTLFFYLNLDLTTEKKDESSYPCRNLS